MDDTGPPDPTFEAEAGEPEPRPVNTTKAARIMTGVGWSFILIVLGALGLAIRLVGYPPWWNASKPIVWIPILVTLYAALRDARWLVVASAIASVELIVVGLFDRADGRYVLGRYEILLGLSGIAMTIAAFSGRTRTARADGQSGFVRPTAPYTDDL
jgi:hypothetical protein